MRKLSFQPTCTSSHVHIQCEAACAAGFRWCTIGAHQVTPVACVSANGTVHANKTGGAWVMMTKKTRCYGVTLMTLTGIGTLSSDIGLDMYRNCGLYLSWKRSCISDFLNGPVYPISEPPQAFLRACLLRADIASGAKQ
jgi:hypothetical protein